MLAYMESPSPDGCLQEMVLPWLRSFLWGLWVAARMLIRKLCWEEATADIFFLLLQQGALLFFWLMTDKVEISKSPTEIFLLLGLPCGATVLLALPDPEGATWSNTSGLRQKFQDMHVSRAHQFQNQLENVFSRKISTFSLAWKFNTRLFEHASPLLSFFCWKVKYASQTFWSWPTSCHTYPLSFVIKIWIIRYQIFVLQIMDNKNQLFIRFTCIGLIMHYIFTISHNSSSRPVLTLSTTRNPLVVGKSNLDITELYTYIHTHTLYIADMESRTWVSISIVLAVFP